MHSLFVALALAALASGVCAQTATPSKPIGTTTTTLPVVLPTAQPIAPAAAVATPAPVAPSPALGQMPVDRPAAKAAASTRADAQPGKTRKSGQTATKKAQAKAAAAKGAKTKSTAKASRAKGSKAEAAKARKKTSLASSAGVDKKKKAASSKQRRPAVDARIDDGSRP